MPYRRVNFSTGNFYHVYNRGVEKRNTFLNKKDFKRFLDIQIYYSRERQIRFSFSTKDDKDEKHAELVEITAYCLMPNHFHLLLRQKQNLGISKFLRLIQNSYTKYFNTKYKRTGHLFQGTFKAVYIATDEQLLHVSRYIHLNPLVAKIIKNPKEYEWSSLRQLLDQPGKNSNNAILEFFMGGKGYEEFINNHADYALTLERIKHESIDF